MMTLTRDKHKFIVRNVFPRDHKRKEYVPHVYKITPVDESLVKEDTNFPLIYVGLPMVNVDANFDVPNETGFKLSNEEFNTNPTEKTNLMPEVQKNVQPPITLKSKVLSNDLFDIKNAMNGFLKTNNEKPLSSTKNKSQPNVMNTKSLLANSLSMVVNQPQSYAPPPSTKPLRTFIAPAPLPVQVHQVANIKINPPVKQTYKILVKDVNAPGILKKVSLANTSSTTITNKLLKLPILPSVNSQTKLNTQKTDIKTIFIATNKTDTASLPNKVSTSTVSQIMTKSLMKSQISGPVLSHPITVKPVHIPASKHTAQSNNTALFKNLKRPRSEELLSNYSQPRKLLRTGVEIAFEDGINHFVSSLKDIHHIDDEPIKEWNELKKGMEVVAKWTDELYYDAKVVECYFPVKAVENNEKVENSKNTAKKNQTTEKALIKSSSLTDKSTKLKPPSISKKAIICSKCKLVFMKINLFRNHQRNKCHSDGKTVDLDELKVNVVNIGDSINNKRDEKLAEHNSLVKAIQDSIFKPPLTCNGKPLLDEGTNILHRWQLQDGKSCWYKGVILKVLGPDIEKRDCEFEVQYHGEEDQGPYKLKLYEDYPADIRIVPKKS